MSFSRKIIALNGVKVNGDLPGGKLVGPIRSAYLSMIDSMSLTLNIEPMHDIEELHSYFSLLFKDNDVLLDSIKENPKGKKEYQVPALSDIYKNGKVFLDKELRMDTINLINSFPNVYFNDETNLSENKETAKIVIAALKITAMSALDTIEQNINLGKTNPNKENPNRLFFAGTGNPMHHAHMITMLEALAYSDRMDTVEVLIHAIDPRKTDLLNFFHRFTMNEEVLETFAPLVRMHKLDKTMHSQLVEDLGKGVEVDNVNLATAYTADAVLDKSENKIELPDGSKLEFLPSDGESKLFMVMRTLESGKQISMGYIAGSDHRNYMDTHKKNLGLMLDTIGKIALQVKAQNGDESLGFNTKDHTISYMCNVRDIKDIDNNALMVQFGLTMLGLEHASLSSKKLAAAMEKIDAGDEDITPVIQKNKDFIDANMKDYVITQEYIRETLMSVSGEEMLGSRMLYNLDNSNDNTVFTLADALKSSGADKNEVLAYIDDQKKALLAQSTISIDDLNELSLKVMVKALNITDTKDDEAVLDAIENFIGIKLQINYASTSFSSTQVRDYFEGKSESWAAMFLPFDTVRFIGDLIDNSQKSGYSSDAENPYKIGNTLKTDKNSGIGKLLQRTAN